MSLYYMFRPLNHRQACLNTKNVCRKDDCKHKMFKVVFAIILSPNIFCLYYIPDDC